MKIVTDLDELLFSPPEPGCVLYLPGLPGGGGTIHDRSPYGHKGTITGATWTRLPSGLWVLSFDGSDDDVTVPYSASLALSAFSVELWLYNTNLTGNHELVSKGTLASPSVLFMSSSTSLMFYVGGVQSINAAYASISLNTWYHAVGVHDGTTKLYTNGALADMAATPLPPATNSNNVYIGQRADNSNHFAGLLGLIRIYKRALSDLEIGHHFTQEKYRFGVW